MASLVNYSMKKLTKEQERAQKKIKIKYPYSPILHDENTIKTLGTLVSSDAGHDFNKDAATTEQKDIFKGKFISTIPLLFMQKIKNMEKLMKKTKIKEGDGYYLTEKDIMNLIFGEKETRNDIPNLDYLPHGIKNIEDFYDVFIIDSEDFKTNYFQVKNQKKEKDLDNLQLTLKKKNLYLAFDMPVGVSDMFKNINSKNYNNYPDIYVHHSRSSMYDSAKGKPTWPFGKGTTKRPPKPDNFFDKPEDNSKLHFCIDRPTNNLNDDHFKYDDQEYVQFGNNLDLSELLVTPNNAVHTSYVENANCQIKVRKDPEKRGCHKEYTEKPIKYESQIVMNMRDSIKILDKDLGTLGKTTLLGKLAWTKEKMSRTMQFLTNNVRQLFKKKDTKTTGKIWMIAKRLGDWTQAFEVMKRKKVDLIELQTHNERQNTENNWKYVKNSITEKNSVKCLVTGDQILKAFSIFIGIPGLIFYTYRKTGPFYQIYIRKDIINDDSYDSTSTVGYDSDYTNDLSNEKKEELLSLKFSNKNDLNNIYYYAYDNETTESSYNKYYEKAEEILNSFNYIIDDYISKSKDISDKISEIKIKLISLLQDQGSMLENEINNLFGVGSWVDECFVELNDIVKDIPRIIGGDKYAYAKIKFKKKISKANKAYADLLTNLLWSCMSAAKFGEIKSILKNNVIRVKQLDPLIENNEILEELFEIIKYSIEFKNNIAKYNLKKYNQEIETVDWKNCTLFDFQIKKKLKWLKHYIKGEFQTELEKKIGYNYLKRITELILPEPDDETKPNLRGYIIEKFNILIDDYDILHKEINNYKILITRSKIEKFLNSKEIRNLARMTLKKLKEISSKFDNNNNKKTGQKGGKIGLKNKNNTLKNTTFPLYSKYLNDDVNKLFIDKAHKIKENNKIKEDLKLENDIEYKSENIIDDMNTYFHYNNHYDVLTMNLITLIIELNVVIDYEELEKLIRVNKKCNNFLKLMYYLNNDNTNYNSDIEDMQEYEKITNTKKYSEYIKYNIDNYQKNKIQVGGNKELFEFHINPFSHFNLFEEIENIKEFLSDIEGGEEIIEKYETNLKETISVYNYILVAFDTNNYDRDKSEKKWNDESIASPRRQLGTSSTNITPWKTTEEEKNRYDPPLYYWRYGGGIKGKKLKKEEAKKYKVECHVNGSNGIPLRLDYKKLSEKLTDIPYGSLITDSEKRLMLRTLSIPRVFIEEDDDEYQVYEKNTSEIDEEQEDDSEFDNIESLGEIAEREEEAAKKATEDESNNNDRKLTVEEYKKSIYEGGKRKNTRKLKKKTTRKKTRKK